MKQKSSLKRKDMKTLLLRIGYLFVLAITIFVVCTVVNGSWTISLWNLESRQLAVMIATIGFMAIMMFVEHDESNKSDN